MGKAILHRVEVQASFGVESLRRRLCTVSNNLPRTIGLAVENTDHDLLEKVPFAVRADWRGRRFVFHDYNFIMQLRNELTREGGEKQCDEGGSGWSCGCAVPPAATPAGAIAR